MLTNERLARMDEDVACLPGPLSHEVCDIHDDCVNVVTEAWDIAHHMEPDHAAAFILLRNEYAALRERLRKADELLENHFGDYRAVQDYFKAVEGRDEAAEEPTDIYEEKGGEA